jgi:hypothetical protein
MSGFVSMPFRDGTCQFCQFALMDGEPLLGHGDHVFHHECLWKMLSENPSNSVRCPEKCDFVATQIDGKSIAVCLKQMGIKPTKPAVLPTIRYSLEFIIAASELDLVCLQQLLESECPLSVKDRGAAVVAAAQAGDDGRVIDFLLRTGSISDVDRGKAAIAAMTNKKFPAFRILVESGPRLDAESFLAAVLEAVKSNQIEYLHSLMNSQDIDPMTRSLAINQALKIKAFDIVHELLPAGVTFSECYVEKFLLTAIRLGRQDILELFCRQPIPVEILKTAIQCAKDLRRVEMVRWLKHITGI